MHELLQISFAARIAMLSANFVIFCILAGHTRNRLDEGSRVFWLVFSFAGVTFATFCTLLWNAIITVSYITGHPHDEYLLANIITLCSVIMMIFALPLIRVLTIPSRTIWFGGAFIFITSIISYIWAGKYL